VRNYQNIFFRVKMIMLVLALLNIWYVPLAHPRAGQRMGHVDRRRRRRAWPGIASLALWAGVVVAGRMIAYNWFDCDIQPQSDFINWAAGCVVPSSRVAPRPVGPSAVLRVVEATALGDAIRNRCGCSR
jgi:hypothetical protein